MLGIATRVTGAVFDDGRGRCSFGQHAHGARAHGLVREGREVAVRGCGVSRAFQRAGLAVEQSCSVNFESTVSTANTLDTLRRALEHSADYAGRSPDSAACGAAHNFSALCSGARPKPPVLGDGGLFSTAGDGISFPRNQHHSAISSRSSSCASASKAASSASALVGSDGSSPVPGTIERARRTFPGCVAVWISFKRRIETWV